MYDRITVAESIQLKGQYQMDEILEDGLDIGNRLILDVMGSFDYQPQPEAIKIIQQSWLKGTFR